MKSDNYIEYENRKLFDNKDGNKLITPQNSSEDQSHKIAFLD